MKTTLLVATLAAACFCASPVFADSSGSSTDWSGGAIALSAGYQNSLIKMGFGDTHVAGPALGAEGELLLGKSFLIGPRIDVVVPLSENVVTSTNKTYLLKAITKPGPEANMGLVAGYVVMPDLMVHVGFDWGITSFTHSYTCKPGSAACPAIPGEVRATSPGIGLDGGLAFAPWGPRKPQLDLTASYMSYLINSTGCPNCSRADLNVLLLLREPF